MIGTQLTHYEIVAHLGSGGMGDVYAATDLKLGRRVALKLLPDAFAHDADRLLRFQREARVLAALNHPNIAAIYGIEDAGARRFLVMELVEGQTLAERLARGPLPIGEVLTITVQILNALDAAHEKGIVHRDLKPANIKITSGGVVKLLDFGLAKDTSVDVRDLSQMTTDTALGTRAGLILGTAAYMSPEQARGLAVDKRTDIWAFGCLVYEMLTGRAAFAGETITDTLAAVLEREPDWSALPPSMPPKVRRLLERCLTKDPRRRLRDVGDIPSDLEDEWISDGVTTTAAIDSTSVSLRRWQISAIASILALVATSIVLAVMLARGPRSAPTSAADVVAARLTTYTGSQRSATLAPDGQSFVFVSDHDGQPDIWLRQVSGGEPVRLTNDLAEELDLAFSPDGENIYFSRTDGGEQAVWRIGRLGGQIQKVVSGAHSPAPSPDGRNLAYMVPESDPNFETLEVSRLDGGSRRAVSAQIPNFPRVRPAWSPDGFRIAYARAGLLQPANLFVVDLRDGQDRQATRFTRVGANVGQAVWLPDNRHIVVSYLPSSQARGVNDLGLLDVTDGSISRITTSIDNSFTSPSASANGSRLIATATSQVLEVWKVPLGSADPDVNGRAAMRLIDATQAPSFTFVSRDKRVLLFNSPASGSRNLWTMPIDRSSRAKQVTNVLGDVIQHSALSPDGKRVVFVSTAGGWADLWIQNVDGSDLRQLTSDPASDAWPTWSPDGSTLLFDSTDSGAGRQTKLMSAAGGPSRTLIDGRFRGDWVEQPDGTGTWIITSNGVDAIRLIDVEQGQVVWQEPAPGSPSALPMFSPDRRFIAVQFQETRATDAINIIDVATRQRRVAARLPFRVQFRVDWVDNGTALIVNRADTMSHIVLFDRFSEPEIP